MKRFFSFLFLLLFSAFVFTGGVVWSYAREALPALELNDGDIVFQTSRDDQFGAVAVATLHPYTHMGIIKRTPEGPVVIEAAGKVGETPLSAWFERGVLRRFAAYRVDGLSATRAETILQAAKKYYGRPYDIFFTFDTDRMYCSELVYSAFKDAGLTLGKVQKISSLHIDNWFAQKLIETRWQMFPACAQQSLHFEECYQVILEQELITPVSIARDAKLTLLFSNYPWE